MSKLEKSDSPVTDREFCLWTFCLELASQVLNNNPMEMPSKILLIQCEIL